MKICFLNGPNKGREFLVKKGLILSRIAEEEGDIGLKEPLASNPHAEIIQKKEGFYLQDLDSKNGTYVEGEIQNLFFLKPGLIFKIGDSSFEVREEPKAWNELILKKLENVSIENKEKTFIPINPALVLQFKSGPQKGDEWHLCYGPRVVGRASLDLSILDSEAPNICFSLEPKKVGEVLFKTLFPEQVLLNKKHLSKKVLKPGDFISFANTFIEINYDKSTVKQKKPKKKKIKSGKKKQEKLK